MATLATYLAQLEKLQLDDGEDLATIRARFSEEQLRQPVTARIRTAHNHRLNCLKIQLIDQDNQELCSLAGTFSHDLRGFIQQCQRISSRS